MRDPTPQVWIERRAKLFEAGEYPDKGVTVTEGHLALMHANFDAPVPLLIEHEESPLELGFLSAVEVVDGELFGTVRLTPEANALVERSGASALSLGLSPELDKIREVSLVRRPRVADARLFSGVCFEAPLGDTETLESKYTALEAQVRRDNAQRQAEALVTTGRLTPAQLPFALALLGTTDTVTFDGTRVPVGQVLMRLLEARPAQPMTQEIAPASPAPDFSHVLMLPEEAEFYRRYFPDISLDQIAAKRGSTDRR
jgi:hypothetical protein